MFSRNFVVSVALGLAASNATAQTVTVTYQGQLKQNGSPIADGPHNLTFHLFSQEAGGMPIASCPQASTLSASFTDGLVTVPLTFDASCFDGDRWLELQVEGFPPLAPRQKLTFAPYAATSARPWATDGNSISTTANRVCIGGSVGEQKLDIRSGNIGLDNQFSIAFRDSGPDIFGTFIRASADNALTFSTYEHENLRISHSGNVGIGTSSPARKLHVFNGPSGGTPLSSAAVVVEDDDDCYVNVIAPNGTTRGIAFGSPASALEGAVSYSPGGLRLWAGGSPRIIVDPTGNVGIGTSSPAGLLHVVNGSSGGASLSGATAIVESDQNCFLNLMAPNNAIRGIAFGSPTSSSGGAIYYLDSQGISLRTGGFERMVVDPTGKVGIGTDNPTSALTVCGDIRAVGNITAAGNIIASVAGACPDFVFDQEYALMPPDELRAYLDCNKHLPHMPSGADMQRDGIDLGTTEMCLLQSTEDLTLYMLNQQSGGIL